MATEVVLILAVFAFVVLGVFFGPLGPIETFKDSVPRLGTKIERQISVGHDFYHKGRRRPTWEEAQ